MYIIITVRTLINNKFMQDALDTPQPYIPVEDAEVPEWQHGAIGRRGYGDGEVIATVRTCG